MLSNTEQEKLIAELCRKYSACYSQNPTFEIKSREIDGGYQVAWSFIANGKRHGLSYSIDKHILECHECIWAVWIDFLRSAESLIVPWSMN